MLGPRVNAGGRVGEAALGARLLSSDDPHEVAALALRLDEFNAERRAIEREVLDQAIARIEGQYGPDRKGLPAVLVVESEGWHVGVIGIVASRLSCKWRTATGCRAIRRKRSTATRNS